MNRCLPFLLFLFLAVQPLWGQTGEVPGFVDYPAKVEKPRAKAVNLSSHKDARLFRTRLREGFREGPNFAGHYTIVIWGCGTACLSGAVIDMRTGRVYFPPELGGIGAISFEFEEALTYNEHSRLLIVRGIPGPNGAESEDTEEGAYYYEWKNNRFHKIKFIEIKRPNG
ncbi:MAG: hypothetical protein KF685_13710 [Acidobacteria bacterium]|nr:hypothetical protein [Acidobacteriota bacterium]